MNETIQTILKRRSIRNYKSEQIKDEELNVILEAAKFAPSGMNRQAWHFTAVQKKETLKRINEIVRKFILNSGNGERAERAKADDFNIFYEAPTLIIVSADKNSKLSQFDCALALGSMFLAAHSLGVSSCWIHAVGEALNSSEENKNLIKELGIPEDYAVFCSGAFGYNASEHPEPAVRNEGTVTIVK
jgi:nitroreductase